jgi:hypothetical protein
MTQKNAKYLTFYNKIDKENGRKVSAAIHIIVSETGTVYIGTYLLFCNTHIHVGKKRPRRVRAEQYKSNPRKYRTKTEDRQHGMGAFNILEQHREDMDGMDDSLTTEFMMDLIAGFTREQPNR